MTKIVDVVDENDTIIGRLTRDECHERGVLHRIVHVLVIDKRGRILVAQRAADRKLAPNWWDASAGGHVDLGESYEDAAKRELEEELGLKWQLKELFRFKIKGPHVSHFCTAFACFAKSVSKIDAREIQKVEFRTFDEIDAMMKAGERFTPDFQLTLQKLKGIK